LEEVRGKEKTCLPDSTPLDGERETTSFKFIGRSERKRKDFYSPIYTYSELKPTVLLAAL